MITIKRCAFIFAVLVLAAISCKKTAVVENAGLAGKWQLREIFDAYVNGGVWAWKIVPADDADSMAFGYDGQYTRQTGKSGNFKVCTGTYQLLADDKLKILSDCNAYPQEMTISELTPTTLILDMQGIEGTIRYKYAAIK